jgi:uncharacterized RDD family membrane protein YckC
LIQPTPAPTWKQEVNRRIAAHKSHGGLSAVEAIRPVATRQGPSSRAAQAAARVAARYAKAPSYSQMQATEARAARHAAEIATQAALDAQAAAQAALEGLEAAPAVWEPEESQSVAPAQPAARNPEPSVPPAQAAAPVPAAAEVQPAVPVSHRASESPRPQVRWDEDFPVRAPEPAAVRAPRHAESLALPAEDGRSRPASAAEPWGGEAIEPVEAIVPIHANLIQFPRELVATRKVRPRLAEGPLAAAASETQLSIFEVDPGAVSTQPEAPSATPAPAAQAWAAPEWSSIELEAQPQEETLPDDPPTLIPALEPASFSRRLLAAVVDGTLITGAFLAASTMAMNHMDQLPPARILELGAASAFAFVALLYQMIFFTLGESTPGMRYARVSLCTFDDQSPTRAQVRRRLASLLVSVVPVGLGVAWAIFDDSHLMWHDRLSRTYLRKC